MVGQLAASRAGHDREEHYLVIREEGGYAYLANGRSKTWAAPKKKNKKHICLIPAGLSEDEVKELAANPADADTKIKRWIKNYERNSQ